MKEPITLTPDILLLALKLNQRKDGVILDLLVFRFSYY